MSDDTRDAIAAPQHTAEDRALRLALPVTLIAYVLFFGLGWLLARQNEPLNNPSLVVLITLMSMIVPFVVILTGLRRRFRADAENRGRPFTFTYWFWRSLVITIAYTMVFTVVGFIGSLLVLFAFRQLLYAPYAFALWPALVAGMWTYFCVRLIEHFKPTDIVNLVGVFLIGGIYLSAVLNPNPQWWNKSISYLGMPEWATGGVLNLTLIFSGVLLLALSSFIGRRFTYMYERGMISQGVRRYLTISFVVAPVALIVVGFVPWRPTNPALIVHNMAAYTAFGTLGAVMASAYWTMPFFSKYFMRINYSLLAVLLVGSALKSSQVLSNAMNELLSFAVLSVWLVLFLRSVDAILDWNESGRAFK